MTDESPAEQIHHRLMNAISEFEVVDINCRDRTAIWRELKNAILAAIDVVVAAHVDACHVFSAPVTGWQPIETFVPTPDECDFLVCVNLCVGEARWHYDEQQWWWAGNDPTDAFGRAIFPSYWQPLPGPPKP